MRPSIALAALGTFTLVLGLIFMPAFMPVSGCGCSGPAAEASACLSNVKQQALGLIMYADDSDDRFPRRDAWTDAIEPYTKTDAIVHDPALPKGDKDAYGYAFNAALSGEKSPKPATTTPMVYDSLNPVRNASDLVTSLPNPGRHHGQNSIAYADGHAKRVPQGVRP